jgi:hypothetical protein
MALIPIAAALAQFAPSLMRYFGAGEASAAVAQKVVDIAAGVTGTKDHEEILASLKANPELAYKFNLAVIAADGDLEKAYLADRQDARRRDVDVRKLTGGTNRRADVMIVCDWLGLIACLVVLTFFRKEVPGEVVALLSTIASIFGLCLRDAHQFEFGTSRGSRDKDEHLFALSRKS